MLRMMLNLECCDCGNPFPHCGVMPSPVDGAIYTPAMLREEAKAEGWKRVRNDRIGSVDDCCPRCASKRAAAKKKAGRQ